MLTLNVIRQSLEAAGEPYHVITLADHVRLVATQRGARLLGPFRDDHIPALFWVNPVLAAADQLQAFTEAGEWNLGGERMWIAPEIQFNIRDRADFWGTHHIPAALDPGRYTMLADDPVTYFHQQVALEGYNTGSGKMLMDFARQVWPVPNPLRGLAQMDELMDGVQYAGYAQQATLAYLGGARMCAEAWNLVQLNAGGTLYIPAAPGAGASPYFGDPSPDALTADDGAFRVAITGQRQYKTGYKAAYLTGRMAYLHQQGGTHYLLVRQFNNDPSNLYAEEPPTKPGERGYAVHVYNDGGQFGANGEMEANGRTIGGEAERTSATDVFNMWMFFSDAPEPLRKIGTLLLGVAL